MSASVRAVQKAFRRLRTERGALVCQQFSDRHIQGLRDHAALLPIAVEGLVARLQPGVDHRTCDRRCAERLARGDQCEAEDR